MIILDDAVAAALEDIKTDFENNNTVTGIKQDTITAVKDTARPRFHKTYGNPMMMKRMGCQNRNFRPGYNKSHKKYA